MCFISVDPTIKWQESAMGTFHGKTTYSWDSLAVVDGT